MAPGRSEARVYPAVNEKFGKTWYAHSPALRLPAWGSSSIPRQARTRSRRRPNASRFFPHAGGTTTDSLSVGACRTTTRWCGKLAEERYALLLPHRPGLDPPSPSSAVAINSEGAVGYAVDGRRTRDAAPVHCSYSGAGEHALGAEEPLIRLCWRRRRSRGRRDFGGLLRFPRRCKGAQILGGPFGLRQGWDSWGGEGEVQRARWTHRHSFLRLVALL